MDIRENYKELENPGRRKKITSVGLKKGRAAS